MWIIKSDLTKCNDDWQLIKNLFADLTIVTYL